MKDFERSFGLTKLSAQAVGEGWLSLFDGETMFGWRAESETEWRVEDGMLISDSGPSGLLRTTTQFDDFVLMAEFKCDDSANSGIFLRTSPKPKNPAKDCLELNIAPTDNPFPTASLVGRKKAPVLMSELKPDPKIAKDLDEGWHKFHVLLKGGELTIWIDGNFVMKYEDPNPLGRGYLGLQHRQGAIAFRKIHIRPLGLKPMFNGKNLEGWDTSQKLTSQFSVTDKGELEIKSGRGQIESKLRLQDFYFRTSVMTNAEGLNSGVFFRSIPGELMNGYESQIQNQMTQDDPTKPVDCGTGGIFRRVDARRIVAKDKEWFHKTIIAEGPHFSIWVNGYQVTDWTDKRKPHANPRKGLRRDAGTIIIQGHDPTTDILMKTIEAREMTVRKPKNVDQ